MSSTLQFVVAGALIVAWVWMLGRPILTNLFRRSRRDSVGYFRYQQAVLSQQGGPRRRSSLLWEDRPRPLLYWRSQQLEQRRLQTMLGFAIATFISMLLAIALRGVFVRLFLVVGICFVLYLCVAAYIGAAQLRRQLEVRSTQGMYTAKRADPQAQVHGTVEQAPGLRAGFDRLEPEASEVLTDRPGSVLFPAAEDNSLELYDEASAFYDDAFFEPIPELTFEPLNLDASQVDPSQPQPVPLFGEDSAVANEELFEADDDEAIEVIAAEPSDQEPPANDEPERSEPTFMAAPVQRQRPPKRSKARPIYIESQLDEGDEQTKAVND